jgi:probable rRNA maturation factor
MVEHSVVLQVEEEYEAKVEAEALRRSAVAVLAHERVALPCEIAVVVSGQDTMRDLNRRFRGIDMPTDVLSFPNEPRGPFAGLVVSPQYLGDVVISFSQAQSQARDAGHEVGAELVLLVVHGVLHLLGYDDAEPADRERMWAAQRTILHALGVEVNLPT